MVARQSRGCRWRAWRGAQRRAARQLRSCPSSGWDGSASRVPGLLRVPSSDPGSASAQPCSTSHLLESQPRCLPTGPDDACLARCEDQSEACAECPGLCQARSKHSAPSPSQWSYFYCDSAFSFCHTNPTFSCRFSQLSPGL